MLLVAGLVIAIFQQRDQDARDVASAASNAALTSEVGKANAKLDKLASITGITIPGDLNSKLDYLINNLGPTKETVAKLADIAEAEKEYHGVAMLNMIGKPGPGSSNGIGDIDWTSPLITSLDGTYIRNGDKVSFKTDLDTENRLRDSILRFPTFPFSYVGLAVCLKNRGDPSWKTYASEGQAILQKTTIVPGHNPDHDSFLKAMPEFMQSSSTPEKP